MIIVGFISPRSNFMNTDSGIKLMQAPKSHNTSSKVDVPIVHGIMKLPKSFSFWGFFFWKMTLYSYLSLSVSNSTNFLFLTSFPSKIWHNLSFVPKHLWKKYRCGSHCRLPRIWQTIHQISSSRTSTDKQLWLQKWRIILEWDWAWPIVILCCYLNFFLFNQFFFNVIWSRCRNHSL